MKFYFILPVEKCLRIFIDTLKHLAVLFISCSEALWGAAIGFSTASWKTVYRVEPAISLHSHHVSLVQWTTCLLPVIRDPGSNP